MLTETVAKESLVPYLDGALSAEERGRVETHLQSCAECSKEVEAFRRLNQALGSFAPPPAVSFERFWLRLVDRLPAPGRGWLGVRPRHPRLALAFALAAVGVLTATASAFASSSALPDNPLYPVKHLSEEIRLTLALDPHAHAQLALALASERLREAQAMAALSKNQLAVTSLSNFDALLAEARAGLRHPSTPAERQALQDLIQTLRSQLTGIQSGTVSGGDDEGLGASLERADSTLSEDESEVNDSGRGDHSTQPPPHPQGSDHRDPDHGGGNSDHSRSQASPTPQPSSDSN